METYSQASNAIFVRLNFIFVLILILLGIYAGSQHFRIHSDDIPWQLDGHLSRLRGSLV
jgi:hypothetical protein